MTAEVVRDPHGVATCPRCSGEIAAGSFTCEGCGLEVEDLPSVEDQIRQGRGTITVSLKPGPESEALLSRKWVVR